MSSKKTTEKETRTPQTNEVSIFNEFTNAVVVVPMEENNKTTAAHLATVEPYYEQWF